MKKGFFGNSIRELKIVFHEAPSMVIIYTVLTALEGFAWVLPVICMQRFLDTAALFARHKTDTIQMALALVMVIAAHIFSQVMNGAASCSYPILTARSQKVNNLLLFERIGRLRPIEFEDTERLDAIDKAIKGSKNAVALSLTFLDILFFYTVYFVCMGWYLFTLKPILAVSVVLVFIPSVLTKMVQSRSFGTLETRIAPLRRETDYYKEMIGNIGENRHLGITAHFVGCYKKTAALLNRLTMKVETRKTLINLLLSIVAAFGYGGIVYLIFISVMHGDISIGAFAAVLTSIYSMFGFMDDMISIRIGNAYESLATVRNYFDFLDSDGKTLRKKGTGKRETGSRAAARGADEAADLSYKTGDDITFHDVNFRYPGTDRDALSGINLKIKGGQTIAVVGENGSGKSTLCRLILGLYQPNAGDVSYGGRSVTEPDFANTSAVFQNYCRYKTTMEGNITISDTDKPVDETKITALCDTLDLAHKRYAAGIHTKLGREFGGEDLSGGQWQRLAIARGVYRDNHLIVLDEPTAAIDPLEESKLYRDFLRIAKGKTAVIVSHRLGSVKIADRILVMKAGRIVQDGTHDELIQMPGEYRKMYLAQSKWYR